MGESLSSIKTFDKPLAEATTTSLEALKLETEAAALNNNGDFQGGIAPTKRAIELDPNFAMALSRVGRRVFQSRPGRNRPAIHEESIRAERSRQRAGEIGHHSDYYQYPAKLIRRSRHTNSINDTYPRDNRPVE